MDQTIKQKWVKALKSGKYEQGQGMLRGDNKFCCLGVLCDITIPKEWVPTNWNPEYFRIRENIGRLDKSFLKEIDLSKGSETKLINLNDGGCDFNYIANYIEENL